MMRLSRLALVDSLLMRDRSPKAARASRRRRNDTTNRPIRTGTPSSHHRYSGAAKRIRSAPHGVRNGRASWNRPQDAGGQGQLQEDQEGPGVQAPRELFRVPRVAAHFDLGAFHPVDGREDLLEGARVGGPEVAAAGCARDLLQALLVDVRLDVDVAPPQDRIVDWIGRL